MAEFSLDDLEKVLAELQDSSVVNEPESKTVIDSKTLNEDLDSLLSELQEPRPQPVKIVKTTTTEPMNTTTTPSITKENPPSPLNPSSVTQTSSDVNSRQNSKKSNDFNLDDLLDDLSTKRGENTVKTTQNQTQLKPTTPITQSSTSSESRTTFDSNSLDSILEDLPKQRTYSPVPKSQPTSSTTTTTTTSSTTSTNTTKSPTTSTSSTTYDIEKKLCAHCGEKISESYILALDKYWCKNHFNCSQCGVDISGNFFDTPSGVNCEKCALTQFECSICRKPIKDVYLVFENGNKAHRECIPQETCERCKQKINLGQSYTEAIGKFWHNECFNCNKCSTALGKTFVQFEGNPFCQPCINILSKDKNITIQ